MSGIAAIAWSAAVLQAAAYLLYVREALRKRIEPNPTSWLMWAYGTTLVVVIETDQGIHPLLSILPIVCAGCSVAVAALCWRCRAFAWPKERGDRFALSFDLALTAVYAALSLFLVIGRVPPEHGHSARMLLLVCVGASTIVSYIPIVRSTRLSPHDEAWLPWSIWTLAYGLLLLATILVEGISAAALQFWIYPASCMVLSALVCWYVVRAPVRHAITRVGGTTVALPVQSTTFALPVRSTTLPLTMPVHPPPRTTP